MARRSKRSNSGKRVLYREDFASGPGPWRTGVDCDNGSWHRNILGFRGDPAAAGWSRSSPKRSSASAGYAWTQSPWYFDDNHGELFWLHLVFFLNRSADAGLDSADLRDATIDVRLRGSDFDFRGTRLYWWMQGQWDHAVYNWCLTGQPISQLGARWKTHRLTLINDESGWGAMGHLNGGLAHKIVVRQSRSAMEGTLERTLDGGHVNGGFILGHVDPNDPPTGRIDVAEVTVTAGM